MAPVTPLFGDEARASVANVGPGQGNKVNYLGVLSPWTGHVSRAVLTAPRLDPKGMLFLPSGGLIPARPLLGH